MFSYERVCRATLLKLCGEGLFDADKLFFLQAVSTPVFQNFSEQISKEDCIETNIKSHISQSIHSK